PPRCHTTAPALGCSAGRIAALLLLRPGNAPAAHPHHWRQTLPVLCLADRPETRLARLPVQDGLSQGHRTLRPGTAASAGRRVGPGRCRHAPGGRGGGADLPVASPACPLPPRLGRPDRL